MSPKAGLSRRAAWALALGGLLPFFCASCTMLVHSTVHDQSGKALQDAVVYATPKKARVSPAGGRPTAVMVIKNNEFKPAVLPVRTGTGVSFVNRDDIKHQLYSISPAKTFEMSVNRLSSSAEVAFDNPGVVALGCALHDRTIGHIFVLETPYFATTGADGKADLEGLPRGAYEVRAWHPDMKAAADGPLRRVADTPEHRVDVDFTIVVQRGRPLERIPSPAIAPSERRD